MFFYLFRNEKYEDSYEIILMSETKFSFDEFKKMVIAAEVKAREKDREFTLEKIIKYLIENNSLKEIKPLYAAFKEESWIDWNNYQSYMDITDLTKYK